ncbi:MAG: HlyD family efflux transporter periplasmic adaptor subunit [Burkholderiales bacterium]
MKAFLLPCLACLDPALQRGTQFDARRARMSAHPLAPESRFRSIAMKWFAGLMFFILPAAGIADEGHGSSPEPAASASLTPRIEAQSDAFELVAILDDGKLTLYLDRFASNEPVPNAKIEVESGAYKAVAQADGHGAYTAPADALTKPGQYPLVFTVQAGEASDLLNGTLIVPQPAVQSPHGRDWMQWLAWIAGGAIVVGILWLLRRRSRISRAATAMAIAVAVLLIFGGAPAAVFADEGHDKAKGSAPGYAAGDNASARRLADGGVFMPKPAQRQLGVLTIVAEMRDLARSIELNGRVIADPNAGGRVQSTQSGRIEAGPRGLPTLGQKVSKGEVLAYVKPVANAIELGNQRAQLAEINSQYALTEKKVKRLEGLEGAVPQKEIDGARAEFASLAGRKAAVGSSLSNREALIAPVSGVISAATAITGQVVEAREVLFEIVDPQRLLVEALAYDAAIVADIAGASGAPPGGGSLPLVFVGGTQQLREQALPLLFRIKPPLPPLAVGQPIKVIAQTRQTIKGVAVPLAALTRNSAGETVAWVHVGAEKFVAKKVSFQALDGANAALTDGIAAGERIVTAGAAALSQVR